VKLAINAEDLIFAMQSVDGIEACWYLDTENGEVLLDRDENGETIKFMSKDARFLRIEPIATDVAFNMMERFVAELNDQHVARRLTHALSGRKPFRAFKNALCDFSEVREAWFAFEREAALRYAGNWCSRHGIEARLVLSPVCQNNE